MHDASAQLGSGSWTATRRAWVFLALALAVVLAFWPALDGEFVYDDHLVVERNPAVAQLDVGAIATRPMWAFQSSEMELAVGYWRPLATLALALTWSTAGPSPFAFHTLVLALHVAACAAAWALARRISKSDAVGALAALLFGLHPVHVESVAWISAVGDPLSGALVLLALERHLAWSERGARGSPWLAGALFFAALLSKELAVGGIAAAIALDLARRSRPPLVRAWLPMALALLAWWAARTQVFDSALAGFDRTTTHYGVGFARLLTLRAEILGQGLSLLAWPSGLRPFHPFVPAPSGSEIWSALAVPFAALAIWAAFTAWCWSKGRTQLVSASLLAVVPLAALVVRVGALGLFPFAERYLYVPAFGFALLAVLAARALLPARLALIGLALVALAWGLRAREQCAVWRDDETLFRAAAARSPRAPYARWQLGRVLLERYRASGDPAALREAQVELDAALDLLSAAQKGDGSIFATREDHVQANTGQGWALQLQAAAEGRREFESAKQVFELVTERYPESEEAWTGLGVVVAELGDLERAQRCFERALALEPSFVEARRNLGRLWARRGEWQRAREQFELTLARESEDLETLLLLADAQERLGDARSALATLERAARTAPRDVRPIVQRAAILAQSGVLDQAEKLLDRAVELAPDSALAHLQRAKVRLAIDRKHSALESFARACELAPRSFEAHYGAAALLLELEGLPQSMPYLLRAYENAPDETWRARLAQNLREQPIASPEAFLALAASDADRGDTAGALRWVADALSIKPDDVGSLYLQGTMLASLGDLPAARTSLQRAAEIAPQDPRVLDSLSRVLELQGERAAALEVLERMLPAFEREALRDARAQPALEALRQRIENLRGG